MLEEIYESQIQPKSEWQQASELHKAVLMSLNNLRTSMLKMKLWYQEKSNNPVYRSDLEKLERYDNMFEDAREQYTKMFLLPHEQFLNHPRKDHITMQRKDIMG